MEYKGLRIQIIAGNPHELNLIEARLRQDGKLGDSEEVVCTNPSRYYFCATVDETKEAVETLICSALAEASSTEAALDIHIAGTLAAQQHAVLRGIKQFADAHPKASSNEIVLKLVVYDHVSNPLERWARDEFC